MYKYEPELSTNIEISRQNKKIIFSVLTKKRCVKNRSPEQLQIYNIQMGLSRDFLSFLGILHDFLFPPPRVCDTMKPSAAGML